MTVLVTGAAGFIGSQLCRSLLERGDEVIGIDNMTSLGEVCVWTKPFPPEGIKVLVSFSPNAFFTTECIN